MDANLTTLELASAYTGLPTSDPTLALYVSAASQMIASSVGHPLHYRTETQHVSASNGPYLWAASGLLNEITSIEINGNVVAPETYAIDSARSGRIRSTTSWTSTALYSGRPLSTGIVPSPDVVITGTFGFVTPAQATEALPRTLPQDLELACLMVIAELKTLGETGTNIASMSLGGTSVTYASNRQVISAPVRAIIAKYQSTRGWIS